MKTIKQGYQIKAPVEKVWEALVDPKDGETSISLSHENVPDEEEEDIAEGWHRYYLDQIKKLLNKAKKKNFLTIF